MAFIQRLFMVNNNKQTVNSEIKLILCMEFKTNSHGKAYTLRAINTRSTVSMRSLRV